MMILSYLVCHFGVVMRTVLAILASLVWLGASTVSAAIVIQMREQGGDVVFSYDGSLDLAGASQPGLSFSFAGITPSGGDISFGSPSGTESEIYTSAISTFPMFGNGTRTPGNSFDGDPFSVSNSAITMPRGYVNGAPISGSLTFQGQSFDSLGINEVSAPYVWTLNSSGDTVTLSAIPEPSSVAMCMLLSGWFAVQRKRRHIRA